MALSGTLKDFALPDIFQLIGMQRKTGLLTLESDRETVTVVFEQGMVVHADSTVRRLDDLLGSLERLVAAVPGWVLTFRRDGGFHELLADRPAAPAGRREAA